MEQNDPGRIAVLMTVHNRRDTTLECLRRLSAMQYDRERVTLDIFMTDDGCTDGTADAVSDAFPQVHVIQGNGELYWNRGMYAAWQEAAKHDYDFYWWVNDDTFVFEDTLSRMLACSASHEDKAIVVGCTCSSGEPVRFTYGGWEGEKTISDVSFERPCRTMHGNLVLIPRAVFLRLGMNDPYYRHSLGDTDYGLRATENDIGIWSAAGYCGICDLHERPVVWMDPDKPVKERWSNFFSPLGNNPFEYFHYRRKHYGLLSALSRLGSNFIHFLFPRMWTGKCKQ
jgi:GT2 family glycosyltransferase